MALGRGQGQLEASVKSKQRTGEASHWGAQGQLSAQLTEKRMLEGNTELTKLVIYNLSFP